MEEGIYELRLREVLAELGITPFALVQELQRSGRPGAPSAATVYRLVGGSRVVDLVFLSEIMRALWLLSGERVALERIFGLVSLDELPAQELPAEELSAQDLPAEDLPAGQSAAQPVVQLVRGDGLELMPARERTRSLLDPGAPWDGRGKG